MDCMGGNAEIMVARSKDGTAISAMLTLRHGSSVIYKYGCSDHRCHNLGGMPFLFWRLIEQSKAEGVGRIDFGRSDLDNEGLIAFKDKFGTASRSLTYYRYPRAEKKRVTVSRSSRTARQILFFLPDAVRSQASRLLYRHVG
jgi:lipid II:glycine glycyltransferase (peptidoglycan interpeptide bridge formation enzyme)